MREIKVGCRYRHFKGLEYKVLLIAKDSETRERVVVYEALYDCETEGQFWVRPYDMFASEVDHDKYPDVKQRYRFEEI